MVLDIILKKKRKKKFETSLQCLLLSSQSFNSPEKQKTNKQNKRNEIKIDTDEMILKFLIQH